MQASFLPSLQRFVSSPRFQAHFLRGATTTCSCMKRKMVKIGTHSGTFHCDEALGVFMLKQTAQFAEGEVVRSRDPEVLKDMDVVIDVGGTYDPSSHRYDHHQREFAEVFGHGFTCSKLSSAGLVYRHFGKEVISKLMNIPTNHPDMQAIYLQLYKAFIESVDAADNGVNPYDTAAPPKYLNNTTLQARVARLNPRWNEAYTDETLYQGFLKAVELTGNEFTGMASDVVHSWLPGRGYVKVCQFAFPANLLSPLSPCAGASSF
ncbi:hypothetical protein DUNSADRAFT_16394 [Dunaliella salina]|uniref:Metal-dependent protein hydrolase n=1 Tax=Dunaliella salina TaxID=3046 RepID=A0ABQ7G3R3_DUNSA|nr:hypothetical protein DUNSADRAFT_16394 [Dunaliella salina]|eukprot:KAF5829217.1 hypothetical protein DUNSADRAFT_16394 [Dunaliella salina]